MGFENHPWALGTPWAHGVPRGRASDCDKVTSISSGNPSMVQRPGKIEPMEPGGMDQTGRLASSTKPVVFQVSCYSLPRRT